MSSVPKVSWLLWLPLVLANSGCGVGFGLGMLAGTGSNESVAVAADPPAAWRATITVLKHRGYGVPDDLHDWNGRESMSVDGTTVRIRPLEPSGSEITVRISAFARPNAAREARLVRTEIVAACGGRIQSAPSR